jgi:hypothetical protein
VATREECEYFRVPVRPERPASHPYDMSIADVTYEVVEYREQTFYTEGNHLTVWAPSAQTAKATMELLLETYEIYRKNRRE